MDADVIIAGGGPVGLGLAIDLAQRGVATVLLERHAAPAPIPKGQNLTQRTMEHFHFWGAEAALRAARTMPRDYGIGGMISYGSLMGDYHYDWLQRELVRPFYFTDNERLPQYATEAVLRARAAQLPSLTALYGWQVKNVAQNEEAVAVDIAEYRGERRQRLQGRYLVGCDGSHSLVREAAGITQTRSDHDRLMVLLVFKSVGLHSLLQRYPGKSFYCVLHPSHKGYWNFFGRVDLGTTWFFHAPVPLGTTRDNFDFRAYVQRAAGAEFDMEIEHIGLWDLRFAVADRYRSGRFFIAGDAAHSHPPYGGYGINTGLEDAANLGWKLAAALKGWGNEKLLDSYGEERRPVFASTASEFIEKAINVDRDFLARFDPATDRAAFEAEWAARQSQARAEVGCFEPHYEGSPIVFGPPNGASGALGRHEAKARAGHHLTPRKLVTGRDMYEALGEGFTLIALDAAPTADLFAKAAEDLAIPLTILRDTYADGREDYGARLILVRPDQFISWCGDDAADPATILRRAIGR